MAEHPGHSSPRVEEISTQWVMFPMHAEVGQTHPLDPLTAGEIRQAAAIVRRDRRVGGTWRFASIDLKEPAKGVLPALEAGRQASREAIVVRRWRPGWWGSGRRSGGLGTAGA